MFHLSENLFFGRKANGDVRILKLAAYPATFPHVDGVYPSDQVVFDVTVPVDGWCSVVASVSRLGESDNRFYLAQRFHAGR